MCPYETAVLGSSNFCPLFTEDQWSAYGYTLDLQFYGDYGPGSPSGRAQGLGWVLELAARLNHTLPSTQSANINLTLDANPATFPVHQPLYMDMSHDDVIVSVLTALGMQYFTFPGGKGLPRDVREPPARRFKLGEIAPFGAHFVAEVYSCPSDMDRVVLGGETMYENPDLSGSGVETEEWLRFVLNGKPVPLEGVSGCEGGNDGGHGMCRVKGFLGGVEEMVRVAEWDRACLGNYTSPGQVGDGHPV
ncbi:histidine phosphatase family protein [Aspergillus homomorphus CBS 101889]|uniref:Putative acid phosphatase n=1 Tax=Aspergillus homomorphus (strain CBS 101889) TaxID=1450537 RepID=A0A395HVC3_ASPHC|nr:putative acid phosphatase [Aspergillus homomorphus CBS 101889]RAL11881.1 putative acid phosphatase [Aspergillus homomorphus CBS 101889]